VWSSHLNVELLSAPCGGWRRPLACHLRSSTDYLVVLAQNDRLLCFSHRPASILEKTDTSGGNVISSNCNDALPEDGVMLPEIEAKVPENGATSPAAPRHRSAHSRADTRPTSSSGGLRDGAGPAALRLLPAHHGREIHDGACVPIASGVFAAVTASEDGTVRALVYPCASAYQPA
jgi:hypothetical protein